MKIAIIDSGVKKELFHDINLKQVRCYDNQVIEEKPRDYYGHGTAVVSCIYDKYPSFEFISICPGVNDKGEIDYVIEACDMANAIKYAVDQNVDVINVSMGTTDFSNRQFVDEAVKLAYDANVFLVASAPNENKPALPWACCGAIKVRERKGNGYKILSDYDCFEMKNIIIQCQLFKVMNNEGKRIFAHGNSYSAVWITIELIKLILKDKAKKSIESMCEKLSENLSLSDVQEIVRKRFEVVEKMDELENISYEGKRLILYSWTKEMHSIVRESYHNNYKIVGVVDYIKKGHVGKDIGKLSNVEEYGVVISSSLNDISQDADVLVIGYVDHIEEKAFEFNLDYILKNNIEHRRLEVFSFTPVSYEWELKYKKEDIILRTPFKFNYDNSEKLFKHVHSFIPIKKPVLGIFGTSSKQGKLTLQNSMRHEFYRQNINCYHFSTEHQASILGANMTFADGYQNNLTIEVDLKTKIRVLKSLMVYIDNTSNADIILVGGQSWVIPYDIKQQTFMRYAVFLEAIQADCSILVINPLFDAVDYVRDTLSVLKSLYKCKILAIAFSDYTPYLINNRIKYKHLTNEEIVTLAEKWSSILKLPCGCISDSDYIKRVIGLVKEEFQG